MVRSTSQANRSDAVAALLNPRDDDHLLGDSMLMISEWSHDVLEAKLALVKVSF